MSDLNYEQIATDCLINRTEDSNKIIELINSIETTFNNSEDFISVINYFFEISNDYNVIVYLFKKMNKYKSKTSVPVLVDALVLKEKYKSNFEDEDIRMLVRINSAKTLANIKDTSAVNTLLYCLNNKAENYKLRLACAEALGKIGDKYAVVPLSEVLNDENEHSLYLKESAAFALGMIGDMKAVDTLVHILDSGKGLVNKFTFLKERAIEALAKIDTKSDKVFHALEKSLKDQSVQVRINAIEALSNMDDERVEKLIYTCLTDKSVEVVRNAIIALFNISGEGVLNDILNDNTLPDYTIKQVQEVLKEIEEEDIEEDEL
jgi:HEAT repeat protein